MDPRLSGVPASLRSLTSGGSSPVFVLNTGSSRAAAGERLVPPFSADGQSKPAYYFGRPNFGITLVKKAGDARVKEMLRLLNFIASPFGSQEYQLLFYGVQGTTFNYDDQGNPTLTDQGHAEIGDFGSAWYSLTAPAPTWYSPADPQAPQIYQGYEKLLAPMGVEDASIGSFSGTFASKGTILLDSIGNGAQDIIAGRRQLAEWGPTRKGLAEQRREPDQDGTGGLIRATKQLGGRWRWRRVGRGARAPRPTSQT